MSWTKNNEWLSTDRQSVDWRGLRLFLDNLSGYYLELIFALALSMAGSVLVLFIPALMRTMQDSLSRRDPRGGIVVLAAFGLILVLQALLSTSSRFLRSRASFALNGRLTVNYYEKLLRSDIEEYFAFQKRTNLFQRVVDATSITGSLLRRCFRASNRLFRQRFCLLCCPVCPCPRPSWSWAVAWCLLSVPFSPLE